MNRLILVTYHYVRDFPNTDFPRIKGLLTDDFNKQIELLQSTFEMASHDSIISFLSGKYSPEKDLCYLTFDDGLIDHYQNVLPILKERKISAAFYTITSCINSGLVASVHKNHFLMAELEFNDLYARFSKVLNEVSPNLELHPDMNIIKQVYKWDKPEVGIYKYYVNYGLPIDVRKRILEILFEEVFGSERSFSSSLYMGWDKLKELTGEGMSVGGHSDRHIAFSDLEPTEQRRDLSACYTSLRANLSKTDPLPFCYPYGKAPSLSCSTPQYVEEAGFSSAVTTISGWNFPKSNPFMLNRVDTNDIQNF